MKEEGQRGCRGRGDCGRRGLRAGNGGGIKSARDDERTCVTVPVWHERRRGSLLWE